MTPFGRPVPRRRVGRTSRARGDALVRLPDLAWELAKKHAAANRCRDGLLVLLAAEVPLTRACRVRVSGGRLTSDDPATRDAIATLDADRVERVIAWRLADSDATHQGLDTWLRRSLTDVVRADLTAAGHLWAPQVSVTVLVVRRRGREEIWAGGDDRATQRALMRHRLFDDPRQYTEFTARGADILGRAAEPLAAQFAALQRDPAVAAALARLETP